MDLMESSDEEGEIVSECVTNYYLLNSKEEPVSFSSLPLQWNDNEGETKSEQKLETDNHLFLRGMVDGGCQQFYKKALAWKFELSFVHPELYVLVSAKYERWIKLQKPRKSYEDIVRSVLISVHCLHHVKKNPEEVSREAFWKHIANAFSTYEVPPSEIDLVEHLQWIKEAVSRDKDIRNTTYVDSFLSELSRNYNDGNEERVGKKVKFIVDGDDPLCDDQDDDNDENKDEMFDRVCALCDDGGDILGCEGRCIRSFHMTVESGAPSSCETLCYSTKQVEAIQTFLCKNCKYQRHQCFICGRLGSSDRSSGAEVFPCVSATCGHFYHPKCVAELVFPDDGAQAQEFQKKIEEGDSFICPGHKCSVCKHGEDKDDAELLLAICRRCPKAYHRKCLPRNILFQPNDVKGIPQRAWEGLLSKRILIYCLDHKIHRDILTPKRDHLIFPDIHRDRQGVNLVSETRSKAFGILIKTNETQKRSRGLHDEPRHEKSSSMMFPKNNVVSDRGKLNKFSKMEKSAKNVQPVSMHSMKRAAAENIPTESITPSKIANTADMENRIRELMKSSTSSFNYEEFLDQQRSKCGHSNFSNFGVDKTITMGKVECSVKAVQAAVKKIEEGGFIEDAKAVCEPGVLTQLMKWKKKLAVYLSPFLHGKRYTSFGRHFTNVDKLKQVVDRLRWYVQDGDTIVDFCCGSNDFSCLMKEKLDSMGRKCSFKNFDLIQPKNDFNFEKRNWMSVRLEELPEGSNLIMGLNPPFGVQASLANQFIDKALKFRPKLLILIVPKETESLERKKTPYDLIWEDNRILSGKSFYLPGSIDVNDQQLEQWNLEAPPLYLWSRQDWTSRHKTIAVERGHIISEELKFSGGSSLNDVSDYLMEERMNEEMKVSEGSSPNAVSNYLMEERNECYGDYSSVACEYDDDIIRMLEDI